MAIYPELGVLSKVSLDAELSAPLASIVPLYKMSWVLCQSWAVLGVAATNRASHLGESDMPVPGTLEISISPFIHLHTHHTHSPLTSLLRHTVSLTWSSVSHHVGNLSISYLSSLNASIPQDKYPSHSSKPGWTPFILVIFLESLFLLYRWTYYCLFKCVCFQNK